MLLLHMLHHWQPIVCDLTRELYGDIDLQGLTLVIVGMQLESGFGVLSAGRSFVWVDSQRQRGRQQAMVG